MESFLKQLIFPEMCSHQASPQPSLVRDGEMEQLVDDDVVADFPVQGKHLGCTRYLFMS